MVPPRGNERQSLKMCCLCPVYSVITFCLLSLQKTLLHKDRMLEIEADVSVLFVAISGYSTLTPVQNVWRFEVVSNIFLRPPSFVISSSWSSSSMDKVASPDLFTNGSGIHSFPVWKSFLWFRIKTQSPCSDEGSILKKEVKEEIYVKTKYIYVEWNWDL